MVDAFELDRLERVGKLRQRARSLLLVGSAGQGVLLLPLLFGETLAPRGWGWLTILLIVLWVGFIATGICMLVKSFRVKTDQQRPMPSQGDLPDADAHPSHVRPRFPPVNR